MWVMVNGIKQLVFSLHLWNFLSTCLLVYSSTIKNKTDPVLFRICLIYINLLSAYFAVRYDVVYLFAGRRVACVLALQER